MSTDALSPETIIPAPYTIDVVWILIVAAVVSGAMCGTARWRAKPHTAHSPA